MSAFQTQPVASIQVSGSVQNGYFTWLCDILCTNTKDLASRSPELAILEFILAVASTSLDVYKKMSVEASESNTHVS